MAEKLLLNGSSRMNDGRSSGKKSEVVVILGAQWGDEGKGKIVDLLCQRADVVCRCQVGVFCWREGDLLSCHKHLLASSHDSDVSSTCYSYQNLTAGP